MRSSKERCRPRRPDAAVRVPTVALPPGRPTSTRHLHTRGHLLRGELPRCGCGRDVLVEHRYPSGCRAAEVATWQPHRHQHTGWRRAHLIYSDRMPRLFR